MRSWVETLPVLRWECGYTLPMLRSCIQLKACSSGLNLRRSCAKTRSLLPASVAFLVFPDDVHRVCLKLCARKTSPLEPRLTLRVLSLFSLCAVHYLTYSSYRSSIIVDAHTSARIIGDQVRILMRLPHIRSQLRVTRSSSPTKQAPLKNER